MGHIQKVYWFSVLTLAMFLSPRSTLAQWYVHEFNVMGTSAKVELWSESDTKGQSLIQGVVSELNRIDQLMSPYIKASELSYINQNASESPVKVSDELFQLIELSIQYSEKTSGAFDITYASVGHLYDYRNKVSPSANQVKANRVLIDYRAIQLDKKQSTVFFAKKGIKIDLGGIAKGHAVDRCIELLKREGIEHAFVQAGGDSRLLGDKRGNFWSIGIRHPRQESGVITQLPLENVAVSTSGDYERFFIKNGERVHHIVEPKTGRSATKSMSVTIISDRSVDSDALSTSVFVLGPVKGLALVNRLPNVSAIIIDDKGTFFYSDDLVAQ